MLSPKSKSGLLEIFETKDGSNSLRNTISGDTYHSVHGAMGESQHVFVQNGLMKAFEQKTDLIKILELGFGTGLNALLCLKESIQQQRLVEYHSLEKYPVTEEIYSNLDFHNTAELREFHSEYLQLHTSPWDLGIRLGHHFSFTKYLIDFVDYRPSGQYDVIFHDAFAPDSHPEVWKEDFLTKCYQWLADDGFLITYCAKGSFKRALKDVGFVVESLPGPPGKREITRAFR